jgi:cell division protein FtsW (lipid II flippase)
VVKIVIVIYLAKVFSSEHDEWRTTSSSCSSHAHHGVMFMLILLQPDFGTAIDLLFVSVVILFVSGFRSSTSACCRC